MVEVTQVDRNAAIRLLEAGDQDWQAKEVRIGQGDHFPLVQAFAAHRIAALAERDAQSAGQTLRHITADQFRQIAEKLEAFGWLERGEPKPKSNTPRWIVNPRVHDLFADRAALEIGRREAARNALRNALMGES